MATTKKTISKKLATPTVKKAEVTPVAKEKKLSPLEAPLYNLTGAKTDVVSLPKHIFGVAIQLQCIAQAVRVYLANQRTGNASTKTRGEVEGSTRKIYKQKGTGRARHGGIRAPIFVGGGIVFGPKPRDYSLTFPQQMRVTALKGALSLKQKEGHIVILDAKDAKAKTKTVADCFAHMGTTRSLLVVVPSMQDVFVRSSRNISYVDIVPAYQLTTYDVTKHKTICITKEALTILETRFV